MVKAVIVIAGLLALAGCSQMSSMQAKAPLKDGTLPTNTSARPVMRTIAPWWVLPLRPLQKNKGDAVAPVLLAKKGKDGGVGVWGQIPMPPDPTVTDQEMPQLVAWILSLE